jgi:hypothetical protein
MDTWFRYSVERAAIIQELKLPSLTLVTSFKFHTITESVMVATSSGARIGLFIGQMSDLMTHY